MANFQSLLDQAVAATSPVAQIPTLAAEKKNAVATASAQKQASLLQPGDYYSIAAGMGNQRGASSMSEIETDLRTLSPLDLSAKYGPEQANQMMAQLGNAQAQYATDQSGNRGALTTGYDLGTGVATGFAGSVADIGSFGIGLVNDQAGAFLAQKTQDGRDAVEESQSETLNAARKAFAAKNSLDARDNQAAFQKAVAEGKSEAVAGTERFFADLGDTLANAGDPTLLAQGTAEGVGSLLVAGPLSKAVKAGTAMASARATGAAAGVVTPGGAKAAALLESAALPASIGTIEAASTYTQTVNSVMSTPTAELMQTSEDFRQKVSDFQMAGLSLAEAQDKAKVELASETGQMAAAVQFPAAVAAGGLTRFAEAPFKVKSVANAASNALVKEPLEEAIQGTTGQLAQNFALQQNVNEDQSLVDGAGEGAALGALYGAGTGAAVQTPGAVVAGTAAVAKGAVNLARKGVTSLGSVVDARLNAADAEVSQQTQQQAAELAAVAPADRPVVDAAVEASSATPEEKVKAKSALDLVYGALDLNTADIPEYDSYPEGLRNEVESSGNTVGALQKLSAMVTNLKDPSAKFAASHLMLSMLKRFDTALSQNEDAMNNISQDTEAFGTYNKMLSLISGLRDDPTVKKGLDSVQKLYEQEAAKMEAPTAEQVATPEGKQQINNIVAAATVAPEAGNLQSIRTTLKHQEDGIIDLNENQQQALRASAAIIAAHEKLLAAQKESGLNQAKDVVTGQIITRDKQLKENDSAKRSALEFAKVIYRHMESGNEVLAKKYLNEFGMFVEHMQNKVDAYNRHYAEYGSKGVMNGDALSYQALMPRGKNGIEFRDAQSVGLKGVYLAPNNTNSVDLAQSTATEAQALAEIFNGFVDAYPSLAQTKIQAKELNSDLKGKPQEVVKKFVSGVKNSTKTEPTNKPEVKPEAQSTFVGPDQIAQRDALVEYKATQMELDLTDQQVQQLAERRKAPRDAVTGWYDARQAADDSSTGLKLRSIMAALNHVLKDNIETVYVSMDLANLGGINAFFNNNQNRANVAYRAIADIVREELLAISGSQNHSFLRTGGDELGALISNVQPQVVEEAMQRARVRIKEYADKEGFGSIEHAKDHIPDFGVDLYSGVVQLTPGMESDPVLDAEQNEAIADEKLDIQKRTFKEAFKNVGRSTNETTASEQSGQIEQPTVEGSGNASVGTPTEASQSTQDSGENTIQEQQTEVTPTPVVVTSAPVQAVEPPPAPVVQTPVVPKTNIFDRIGKLVTTRFANMFAPRQSKDGAAYSRLSDLVDKTPLQFIAEGIASAEAFTTVTGKEPKFEMTNNVITSYNNLLGKGGVEKLMSLVNQGLQDFLDEVNKKTGVSKGHRERVAKGEDLATWSDSKPMNLVEPDGKGGFQYNQEMLQTAILAALQWVIESGAREGVVDEDALTKMTGLDIEDIQQYAQRLSVGFSDDQVKFAIANKIANYWGVKAKNDSPMGYAEAIPESIAAEIMAAMVQTPFMTMDKVDIEDEVTGKILKTVIRLQPAEFENLSKFPNLIENLILREPEEAHFLGDDLPPVAQDRMNSSGVKNTADQKKAIEAQQKIPFYLNMTMVNAFFSMGEAGLISLFGSGETNLEQDWLNKEHVVSLEGKNSTVVAAFEALKTKRAQVNGRASVLGVKPHEVAIRYAVNAVKTGRLHMQGKHNPQSNKIMRAAVAATWSTLDLNTTKHRDNFYLALAQALDVKIHKVKKDLVFTELFSKKLTGLSSADEAVGTWLQDQESTFPYQVVKAAFNKAEIPLTPNAVHAYTEYIRSKLPETDKAQFRTALSLEADGVTNGPINALMLLSLGSFTAEQIENLQRGGISIGTGLKKMYELIQTDLYQRSAEATEQAVRRLGKHFNGLSDNRIGAQHERMLSVINVLTPDLKFSVDSNGAFQLNIKRGLMKNPLTITIYGSSAKGIAGKVAGIVTEKLYERISEATKNAKEKNISFAEAFFSGEANPEAKLAEFKQNMSYLLGTNLDFARDEGEKKKSYKFRDGNMPSIALNTAFEVHPSQFGKLRKNMLHGLVEPMVEGINETLGAGLLEAVDRIKAVSQIQSTVYAGMYRAEIDTLVEKLDKSSEFFSRKELEEIQAKLAYLAPLVVGRGQSLMLTKEKTLGKDSVSYSRTFKGLFRTAPNLYVPAPVGVGGIPGTVIGYGDAFMVQNALLSNVLERALYVFDGVEMPLDKIDEFSEQLNMSVIESYKQNPLADLLKTFDIFMEQGGGDNHGGDVREFLENEWDRLAAHATKIDRVELTDKDIENGSPTLFALNRSLWESLGYRYGTPFVIPGPTGWVRNPKIDLVSDLINVFINEQRKLKDAANDLENRHKVIHSVGLSSDQMAGAAVGAHNGQPALNEDSNEGIAFELNKRLKALQQEDNREKQDKILATLGVAATGGARVLGFNDIQKLAIAMKMSAPQKLMFNEVMNSIEAKDTTVITGSLDEINEYRKANGFAPLNPTPGTKGEIEIVGSQKTIFLLDPNPETLVHELIHATTYRVVYQHYANPKASNVRINKAIRNIEVLMEEFLADLPVTQDVELNLAISNSRNAIEAAQRKGDKARALNEFMAWSLSNNKLLERGAKKLPDSVVAKLKKLAKDVLVALRTMLGLHENNTFSRQLAFNTVVLAREAPTLHDQILSAQHAVHDNPSQRLLRMQQMLDKHIFTHVSTHYTENEHAVGPTHLEEQKQAYDLSLLAADIFGLTPEERATFTMFVAAMTTQGNLDSSVISRVHSLFQHVMKGLQPQDLADPETTDADVRYAEGLPRYKMLSGLFAEKDAAKRTNLLSTFLGLAVTSDKFRSVLESIEPPKTQKVEGKTLDAMLENLGNQGMEKLGQLLSQEKKAPNVRIAIDNLAERLHGIAFNEKSQAEMASVKANGVLNRWEDKVVQAKDNLAEKAAATAARLRASNSNMKKASGVALAIVAATASGRQANEQSQALIKVLNNSKLPVIANGLRDLVVDMVGRTKENASIYDLIKPVRAMVQSIRQQFREDIPMQLASKFSRELTGVEYAALWQSIGRSDFASLLTKLSVDDAVKVFTNTNERDNMIADLEEELSVEDNQHFDLLQRKMVQLANHMNTEIAGNNLLRNAEAIANLLGEPGIRGRANPTPEFINKVDRLVTLYSLRSLPQAQKDIMSSLVQNEVSGVKFMADYLATQRQDELAKNNDITKFNHFKGHIPSDPRDEGDLIVADDTEKTRLALLGYTKIADFNAPANDPNKNRRGYYYSPTSQRPAVSQGIAQNVRHTMFGIDTAYGFSTGKTGGRISDSVLVERIAQRMHLGGNQPESMMPIYDGEGNVIAFERGLNPMHLENLERSKHAAKMIGVWRGRQVEETISEQLNDKLVTNLKEMWDKEKNTSRRKEYVNLSNLNALTPVQRDAVRLFSPTMLEQIEGRFGDEPFMVRKDLLNDVIGYRNASVGDFYTGNTEWSPKTQEVIRNAMIAIGGNKAYGFMVGGERRLQAFMTDARTTIVVKSVVIPMYNMMSNMLHLVSRGVPLHMIGKGSLEKLSEINNYAKSRVQLTRLEVEIRAEHNDIKRRKLEAEKAAIEESHTRLSIWPLIQAGEFSTIADVGMTVEDLEITSGRLTEWVEKQVDKLPPALQTAAKYGWVSRDTALFKGLQKAVQYGDFVGKSILFDHLTTNKGMSPKEAMAQITEEFVNYDRLPGRTRGALENSGLLWFYNYKIRTVKVALSVLRNNPLHALLAMSVPMPNGIGTVETDNLFSVALEGNLPYSIGPGMAIHAINLNPWVNAVN